MVIRTRGGLVRTSNAIITRTRSSTRTTRGGRGGTGEIRRTVASSFKPIPQLSSLKKPRIEQQRTVKLKAPPPQISSRSKPEPVSIIAFRPTGKQITQMNRSFSPISQAVVSPKSTTFFNSIFNFIEDTSKRNAQRKKQGKQSAFFGDFF